MYFASFVDAYAMVEMYAKVSYDRGELAVSYK